MSLRSPGLNLTGGHRSTLTHTVGLSVSSWLFPGRLFPGRLFLDWLFLGGVFLGGLCLAADARAQSNDTDAGATVERPWAVELALFPMFTERQIEGPTRDDKLVSSPLLAVVANATYAVDWFEGGLYLHFDTGSSRHATFSRPDATGATSETNLVEGSYWELWIALLLRATVGPAFFELGWAPLMLRNDTARDDLPNSAGETDGTFRGSPAVAFLVGLGGRVELSDRWLLTLRLQLRIRYMVSRGGEDLAGEEEFGQMTAWPFIGAAYRF